MMMHRLTFAGCALLLALLLASCASESEKKASALYKRAQTDFANRDYEKVVSGLTEALSLAGDYWVPFTDGSVHFLRGQANDALGRSDAAIVDYTEAINRGNNYLTSWDLNSNPKPYAKNKFMRNQLARYYEARAKVYRSQNRGTLAEEDLSVVERMSNLPTTTKERMRELLPGQSR
ncbi:MAG TPA: hypothetical protein PLX23_04135 [Candidatus Hydrogenedens sp.]|nr:hypothetical protein [Candidatus Hydrogenedens sp.]